MSVTGSRPFGLYVHVPFCARRCGYCDFNTYTPEDLGGRSLLTGFAELAIREMVLAQQVLSGQRGLPVFPLGPASDATRSGEGVRPDWPDSMAGSAGVPGPLDTVFFGGGTPTLLPASDLAKMLQAAQDVFSVTPDVEVTVEANPETVDLAYLAALAEVGFTRVSFGMQSISPAVLGTLGRRHRPESLAEVTNWARQVGLDVSVDLIYGTPGESMAQWQASLEAVVDLGIDHISCYALTIEPNTPMGRQLAAGLIADTDQDDLAAKYELADQVLHQAGLDWYEISNWARPGYECRHNLGYWRGGQWWGIGPGAHSAIGQSRFWNTDHPRDYVKALGQDQLPIEDGEVVTGQAAVLERIMLGLRLATGLSKTELGVRKCDELCSFETRAMRDFTEHYSGSEEVARLTEKTHVVVTLGEPQSMAEGDRRSHLEALTTEKNRVRGDDLCSSETRAVRDLRDQVARHSEGAPQAGAEGAEEKLAVDGIGQLVQDGLIEDLGDHIQLTLRGRLLADLATNRLAS